MLDAATPRLPASPQLGASQRSATPRFATQLDSAQHNAPRHSSPPLGSPQLDSAQLCAPRRNATPALDATPATRLDGRKPDPFQERNAGPRRGNWGVVYTHSQAERWARDNLQRQGFTVYLPMIRVRRRDPVIRSLWHTIEAPAFSRYLFVQHDNPDFWRPIRETPGVSAVLTCANRMQYARQGAVEAVQAAEALAASSPRPTTQWAPGAAVALSQGPLAAHPAVILSVHRDNARLAVLLFGALREVSAPISWLVARD